MLLVRLAETSAAVAATASRKEKGRLLAELLAGLEPDEIEPAIGFLTGSPRQGAIGVGWATVARLDIEPSSEPSLTVGDLDLLLDEIALTTGSGSASARSGLLASVLSRATPMELELVRRILIGDLRQGALAGVVTDAVATAAGVRPTILRRAVMLLGDLGPAAVIALGDGAAGLAEVGLEVGRPIQPMLASTATGVAEAMAGLGVVQVDWKLDGARIQVHLDGSRVGIYTRNLNDVTDRLPHVVELARSFPCHSAVLDGEVLGFAGGEGPQPFQDTMSAFGTGPDGPGAARRPVDGGQLRPFFFDLMLHDGTSLIDRPLAERSATLDRLVGPHRIPCITTAEPAEAAEHLAASLSAGHEGVMVKALDGIYEAGRRGKSWRKVKPVRTLDLVVIAAEWGHGRRQGWLSNLHLGARDPASGGLVMVGKTFKGMSDELLAWQTEQLLARKVSESQSGHTVHVAPELVVEIALDGVQSSTRYAGGVALRFARVRRYRPDRLASSADTIDTVRNLA
jgi:DNA ligase-1